MGEKHLSVSQLAKYLMQHSNLVLDQCSIHDMQTREISSLLLKPSFQSSGAAGLSLQTGSLTVGAIVPIERDTGQVLMVEAHQDSCRGLAQGREW